MTYHLDVNTAHTARQAETAGYMMTSVNCGARLGLSTTALCLHASDVLDAYFGESIGERDAADPYRSATGEASGSHQGPRLLGADVVWLDGREIWFELVMHPLESQREVTLLCQLVANWRLPQPLYARLDMGDRHWIGSVEPEKLVVGWLAQSHDVLDPRNPGRTRRPVTIRVSTTEADIQDRR
jgi:hypothetical protein